MAPLKVSRRIMEKSLSILQKLQEIPAQCKNKQTYYMKSLSAITKSRRTMWKSLSIPQRPANVRCRKASAYCKDRKKALALPKRRRRTIWENLGAPQKQVNIQCGKALISLLPIPHMQRW